MRVECDGNRMRACRTPSICALAVSCSLLQSLAMSCSLLQSLAVSCSVQSEDGGVSEQEDTPGTASPSCNALQDIPKGPAHVTHRNKMQQSR